MPSEWEQMPQPNWLNDDLRQEALQIIATSHDDGQTASQILYEALSQLEASTLTAEKTLFDRIKHSREKTGLVLLGPALLQRLIFKYSDTYARRQENDECRQTEARMLARYLQALILFCLRRSSRWMAVGVGQFVFSYSGPEVAEMTGRITTKDWDNNDRTRAKRKIMEYLESRFTTLVSAPVTIMDGKHFEPASNQSSLADIVEQYLDLYTPWGTEHVLRSPGDLNRDAAEYFGDRDNSTVCADVPELNRFHVFVDLACFEYLLSALGYAHWRERLRLPALTDSRGNSTPDDGRCSRVIGADILKTTDQRLKLDAARRLNLRNHNLRVYVDDSYVASLTEAQDRLAFTVPPDVDIISLRTYDSDGDILVGCHILSHSEDGVPLPSCGSIRVGGRHRLRFEVSRDSADPNVARCTIEHKLLRAGILDRLSSTRLRWVSTVAIVLLLAAGFSFYYFFPGQMRKASQSGQVASRGANGTQPLTVGESAQGQPPSKNDVTAAMSQEPVLAFTPEASTVRGLSAGGSDLNLPAKPTSIVFRLPITWKTYQEYRAELQTVEGPSIRVVTGLAAQESDRQAVITFRVPSTSLEPRDYILRLQAKTARGRWEEIQAYSFRAVNK